MSHKEKICNTALTSHVEVCHEQHSYTPLVVSRRIWRESPRKSGLKSVIESELEEKTTSIIGELENSYKSKVETIKNALTKVFDKESDANRKTFQQFSTTELKAPTFEVIDEELKNQLDVSIELAKEDIIKSSEGLLDANNPERAIEVREGKYKDLVNKLNDKEIKLESMPFNNTYELEGLGIFFKESVCYRPEGFAYSPCGKEMTIMPGEEIKESNVLTTIVKEDDSNEQTISQEFTTKDSEKDVTTFTESYENKLKKETDIKLAQETSFKIGIPIKKLTLDLSGKVSSAFNFKKIIDQVNKSSHTNTRTRFNEVIRKINTSSTNSSSRSFSSTDKYTHIRNWKNDTDTPQTYVKRKSYCKTSVIHKRHDVHLAWNGCIDNPARDLCTPDNLEVRHAEDIQAIRDRWSNASAPAEFGPEPQGRKECTSLHYKKWGVLFIGTRESIGHFQFPIPAGWSYEGGSASVQITRKDGELDIPPVIFNQPQNGATGNANFKAQVIIKNNRGSEFVEFKVCFNIIPDTAVEWYNKVNTWRDEQAQKEIDAFLAEETKKLNQFLATDQARAAVERRIMEDYFGVTPIQDCCKLIARLRKLFDFDNMGYVI